MDEKERAKFDADLQAGPVPVNGARRDEAGTMPAQVAGTGADQLMALLGMPQAGV